MSANKIQASYDLLAQFSRMLASHSQQTDQLQHQVSGVVQRLRSGDWIGQGAERFFDEIESVVMPGLRKLSDALCAGSEAIHMTAQTFDEAEQEAAALFRGEGVGVGVGGAQSESDGITRGASDSAGAGGGSSTPGAVNIGYQTFITGWKRETNGTAFVKGGSDRDAVDPNDIQQRILGDCFLASSMAAIARSHPEVIREAITENADGTYTVRLYTRDGSGKVVPEYITVTPEFPDGEYCLKNGKTLSFPLHSGNGDTGANSKHEIWPQLIEKAYAKRLGGTADGYMRLNAGGSSTSAMFALTGQGSQRYEKVSDLSINEINTRLQRGEAIVINTYKDSPLYKSGNFIAGHSYYVIGADPATGQLTIKNPHGWDHQTIHMPYDRVDSWFNSLDVNKVK